MELEKILTVECERVNGVCENCTKCSECNKYAREYNEIFEGNNGSYIINGKDLNKCSGIEALTYGEANILASKLLNSSKEIINGHEVFFIDFNGYFGYSALVFLNGKHLYYADDYQLHHKEKYIYHGDEVERIPYTTETLKAYYLETLSKKLFTIEQLKTASTYEDYQKKDYYIRNYYPLQYDRISAFAIAGSKDEEELEKAKKEKYFYFSSVCFSYFANAKIVKELREMADILYKNYTSILTNPDSFRTAIRYELANHEACITMDYSDALSTLGLSFDKLEDWQKRIVKAELSRCIEEYC